LKTYADTSFLVRIYLTQSDSRKALAFMRDFRDPLPFTPLHRHELRNAIRLAVFRREIDAARRKTSFEDIESDLADGILAHVPVSWTNAFRESEQLGAAHTEDMGVRGIDLLHTGVALSLGAKQFLTFDTRQAGLAKAAGLKVKPWTA
jgi:predicted nucleic acid-binding protein